MHATKLMLVAIPIAIVAAAPLGARAAAAERSIDRRIAAKPEGTVEISNVAGRIEVLGWDRAEVQVKGKVERDVERVDVVTEGDRTIVKVVLPKVVLKPGTQTEAFLTVQAPRTAEIKVSTVSADIVSRELRGAQHLSTVSGEVVAALGQGEAQVKTVSGDVTLRGRGAAGEGGAAIASRVKTVSGNLDFEGAGSLEVETVSGDVRAKLDPATALRANTTSGDLDFGGRLTPAARIEAQSMSGDLTVEARAPEGMSVEVESFSGDIRSCLSAKAQRTSAYGPGERLAATVGAGKAQVRLKTFSGDVEVCDR